MWQPSRCRLRTEPDKAIAGRTHIRMVRLHLPRPVAAAPCDDTGVLLACLELPTARSSTSATERKFVLTAPNLRHWVLLNELGDLVEYLCCFDLRIDDKTAEEMRREGAAERRRDCTSGTSQDHGQGRRQRH